MGSSVYKKKSMSFSTEIRLGNSDFSVKWFDTKGRVFDFLITNHILQGQGQHIFFLFS
jgi:hypothetical protein